jgi:hypothetical protein
MATTMLVRRRCERGGRVGSGADRVSVRAADPGLRDIATARKVELL